MKRRCLLIVAVTILSLAMVHPVFAIFGLGDIVFDPSVYAEAIEQVLQLQRQYAQLVQSYRMLENQYEHLKTMAKRVPVDMVARYKAVKTPWQGSSAANTYGTTDGWTNGINTGVAVRSGYDAAVKPLGTYGEAFNNIPIDQRARVKSDYATAELTDGANLAAIETVGRLRANARAVEGTIENLEADS